MPKKVGKFGFYTKRLYEAKNGQIFNMAKFLRTQETKKPFDEEGLFEAF
jgi:hypothetical protein